MNFIHKGICEEFNMCCDKSSRRRWSCALQSSVAFHCLPRTSYNSSHHIVSSYIIIVNYNIDSLYYIIIVNRPYLFWEAPSWRKCLLMRRVMTMVNLSTPNSIYAPPTFLTKKHSKAINQLIIDKMNMLSFFNITELGFKDNEMISYLSMALSILSPSPTILKDENRLNQLQDRFEKIIGNRSIQDVVRQTLLKYSNTKL